MPRSAGCFRPPRVLRSPPIYPFEQITELCGSDRHRPATARRPDEPSPLETLGEQALPLAIVPKTLDEVAATPAKDKKVPAIGIVLEGLLDQERQALIAPSSYRYDHSPARPARRLASRSSPLKHRNHPPQRRSINPGIDDDPPATVQHDLHPPVHPAGIVQA